MGAMLFDHCAGRNATQWSTDYRPAWDGNVVDARRSVAGPIKNKLDKDFSPLSSTCTSCANTKIPLCGYGLSNGPTEGLSSW